MHGHPLPAHSFCRLHTYPSASFVALSLTPAGEHSDMPDAALFCIANAAVYGLVQALQAELRGKPQRVNELRIGAIIRRDNEAEHPHFPGRRAAGKGQAGSLASGGPLLFSAPPQLWLPFPFPALLPTGKKSHPASLVGAQAVAIVAGTSSDEIVRLYLD